jgi:hypothetical protein
MIALLGLAALVVASTDASMDNTVLVTSEVQTADIKARSPVPGEDKHWEGADDALPVDMYASGIDDDLQDDVSAFFEAITISAHMGRC